MKQGALTIPALDGYALPATVFEPLGAPVAAVIVSPATATPRGFYRAFCDYLAARGAVVVTYDYRGTFEAPDELRRSAARMRDWGTLDFPGIVDWAGACYPRLPLYAVGHSVGGHVLLMSDRSTRIERAFLVASQSGYWRFYRGLEAHRVYLFVKAIMPALTRLFGYFPGERVVFGTNLAPRVLYEWSRWCTSPGYFFDDPAMREVLAHASNMRGPVTMLGISDDPWATPRAIAALAPGFTSAPVTQTQIAPSDFGLGAVGHMGFFRAANAALWPLVERAFTLSSDKEYV
ncbi:MAG TPA: alpha/beta hydrolase [Candidatus Aquilonibacter sp.]|nr:alpha/beta hydrolase [Candidatus Aquilonibacter sp.]